MADFAGDAFKAVQGQISQEMEKTPGAGESLMQGAKLGQFIQQTRAQRAALEAKKQEVELAKFAKLGEYYKIYGSMPEGGAKKAFGKSFIPNYINAVGIQDKIHPSTLEMFKSDSQLSAFITNEIEEGRLTIPDLGRPEVIAKFASEGLGRFISAQQIKDTSSDFAQTFGEAARNRRVEEGKTDRAKLNRDAQLYRTELNIKAQMDRQEQKQEVAGIVKEREVIGKSSGAYRAQNGAAAYEKSIRAYQDAIEKLENNKVKLGTFVKKLPFGSTDEVMSRLDGDAKQLVDTIKDNINIRAKSGDPNPTSVQIQEILSRSIDPRLDNEKNIEKLEAEIDRMGKEHRERVNAFVSAGLMTPEKAEKEIERVQNVLRGRSSGNRDPKLNAAIIDRYKSLPEAKKSQFIQQLSRKTGVSPEKVRKALGAN